jgi:hypothetical protein
MGIGNTADTEGREGMATVINYPGSNIDGARVLRIDCQETDGYIAVKLYSWGAMRFQTLIIVREEWLRETE